MAKKEKAPEVEPVEPVVQTNVTVNLDVDPNDPRKQGQTKQLPSLND